MTDPAEGLAQQVTDHVVELLVNALDLNELVARVDLNALLARVDVNALLARVDLNALLDRVGIDAVLERVDVNGLMARVDVDALVEQTDVGALIAQTSGGMLTEALDTARSQAMRLDLLIDRWVQRLLRRKQTARPAPHPALPVASQATP